MIFTRSLALAAFLAPLACAAPPPAAEQPRFTVALDNWSISYMNGPGKVSLGISIMLQGKGTFVIPSSGEGQLTRLAMRDSTGKETPCDPRQPWGMPGKLNPSHVLGSKSSSSPGSPYTILHFSCGFKELPAPQSEWLRIRGTWTVQFCPDPQQLMLKQTVQPAEEPQTFYLDLPEPGVREDSDIIQADSASNTASIQLKTNEERTTLSCEAEFPSSASIQGFAILDSTGRPIPGLRRNFTPEIEEREDGKTRIACLYEMEGETDGEGAGKPVPSLPRELKIGAVYLPSKHSLDVPIDLTVNPSLSTPRPSREPVNNPESGLSARPSSALQVKLYNWFFSRNEQEPVFLGIHLHTDKNHALLNDMEQQGASYINLSTPGGKTAVHCRVKPPTWGTSTYNMLFFPLPRSLPPGNGGWLLTGELRVPVGEVHTTPARTIPAEPGKKWVFDVPAASEGYPPFRLQATLLSIKPSAKECRVTFKLQGHHGKPHFSGFHVEGGMQIMTNKDPEDETAHLITYSFPQPPGTLSCCAKYIVNPTVIRHPLNMRIGLGGIVPAPTEK